MKKGILLTIIGVLSVAVIILSVALIKVTGEAKRGNNDLLCEGGASTTPAEGSTEDTCDEYICDDGNVQDMPPAGELARKPVIYLYPEEELEVSLELALNGRLTHTYPAYNNGWKVTAKPDGTLTDESGRGYYCLFWEGEQDIEYDMSKGFVVAGSDTAAFLEEKLAILGLTEKEANEFIIYWLPLMENNEYNLISFQDEVYTNNAELKITPEPDSVLRVFMAWQALEEKIAIEEQELHGFERTGFTVVEWGGASITDR